MHAFKSIKFLFLFNNLRKHTWNATAPLVNLPRTMTAPDRSLDRLLFKIVR